MHISTLKSSSLDTLEENLISLSEHINQQEYQFLLLVREFDLRQGWRAYYFNNCAEWLNMKCGISPGTAREKVRVAKMLFDLPLCSEAFEKGTLSYSKIRAMTRAATRHNEAELVDYALNATAHQVERHCQRLRNADRRRSTPDAKRAYRERSLMRTCHPNGTMSINIELPQELGDLLMKAIEVAAERCPQDAEGNENSKSTAFFARQADGLVELARNYLSGSGEPGDTPSHQVLVHVDEAALHDKGGESDLPVESVRRIACDADLVEVRRDKKGNVLNLGRKHRVVSPQLKKALLARDRNCRFPGCTHEKYLDAHHVEHWADGGETNLENTLLLCDSHHRLLHEGAYSIKKNFAGDWYFRKSDGEVVPESPVYRPDVPRDAFDDGIRESAGVYRL
ncbi:MAG TPA: hypothetical protein DCM54_03060 [Gammaproteobacteria bacterium]|nr:hypothetical protein [Gammaproteobacteria bacterium]